MAEESKPYISTSDQSSSTKSSETTLNQPQGQQLCGHANGGAVQMLPIMYPSALVPGLFPMQQQQDQEQMNRGGAGLYAVHTLPFMGQYAGFPTNTLIPFTYNVPTGTSQATGGAVGGEAGQMGQQQQQQAAGAQRQVVVRRFQIAIHLDLLLILKLAAVIFLLNQDGSRQRLLLLIFSATLVYLYQTGALAPLVRWLSQGMHRAAARPIQPPRPPVRADNALPAAAAAAMPADGHGDGGAQNDGNQDGVENEDEQQQQQPPQGGGNRWWGIVKEVQMIVFGFITSLLPGFHNLD